MKKFFTFYFILVVLVVFASILAPILKVEKTMPGATWYGYPMNFLGDYIEYVYEIRSGQEGSLLFNNIMTPEKTPPIILGPFYNIFGLATRPFIPNPFVAYRVLQFTSLFFLLFCIYLLIRKTIKNSATRCLALTLAVVATSYWTPDKTSGTLAFKEPETWSFLYNIFTKYNHVQPHHYMAVALLIIILLHLPKSSFTLKSLAISGLLSLILGFVHPYLGLYTVCMIAIYQLSTLVYKRRDFISKISHIILSASMIVPILLYYRYLLLNYWQSPSNMSSISWAPHAFPFSNYALATGLVGFIGIFALLNKQLFTDSWKRVVLIWAIVPIGLYFSNYIHAPIDIRISGVIIQIPFGILSALVIESIVKKIRFPLKIATIVVATFFILYAAPIYINFYNSYTSGLSSYFFLYSLMNRNFSAFNFLEKYTPKESLVVAGEYTSQVLPAFTHNRTLAGHPGINPNNDGKKYEMQVFYYGKLSDEQIKTFLQKYSVRYILFGVEVVAWEAHYTYNKPGFKEIYRDANATIVEVINSPNEIQ